MDEWMDEWMNGWMNGWMWHSSSCQTQRYKVKHTATLMSHQAGHKKNKYMSNMCSKKPSGFGSLVWNLKCSKHQLMFHWQPRRGSCSPGWVGLNSSISIKKKNLYFGRYKLSLVWRARFYHHNEYWMNRSRTPGETALEMTPRGWQCMIVKNVTPF